MQAPTTTPGFTADQVEILDDTFDPSRIGWEVEYRLEDDPEDAEPRVHFVAGEYVVCTGCRGKGTHVNRAVDGHGLTAEDFAEDPDFKEAYMSGAYDVTCDTCGGARVVAEPPDRPAPDDARQLDPVTEAYLDHLESTARADAEDRHYQRMESGDWGH